MDNVPSLSMWDGISWKRPPSQDDSLPNQVSERILGCAFRMMNTLGCGFLEKVCESALALELRKTGPEVSQQHAITVEYADGEYTADPVVGGVVVVELKAVPVLDRVHAAQCMNYLKATGLRLCLLLNFGKPRLEIQMIVN
jgi:GxxExxY protein